MLGLLKYTWLSKEIGCSVVGILGQVLYPTSSTSESIPSNLRANLYLVTDVWIEEIAYRAP